MAVADASFKTSIDSMSSGAIADKGLVSVSEERFSSLTAPSCRFETPEFTQIGRAHVWNSSHLGISYAVFCLKKKNKQSPKAPFLTLPTRRTLACSSGTLLTLVRGADMIASSMRDIHHRRTRRKWR